MTPFSHHLPTETAKAVGGRSPILFSALEPRSHQKPENEFVGWLGYGRIGAAPKYFAVTVSRFKIANVEVADGTRPWIIELSFDGDANYINSTLRFVRSCETARRRYQLSIITVPKEIFGKLELTTLVGCDVGPVTSKGDVRTWKITAQDVVRSDAA